MGPTRCRATPALRGGGGESFNQSEEEEEEEEEERSRMEWGYSRHFFIFSLVDPVIAAKVEKAMGYFCAPNV